RDRGVRRAQRSAELEARGSSGEARKEGVHRARARGWLALDGPSAVDPGLAAGDRPLAEDEASDLRVRPRPSRPDRQRRDRPVRGRSRRGPTAGDRSLAVSGGSVLILEARSLARKTPCFETGLSALLSMRFSY